MLPSRKSCQLCGSALKISDAQAPFVGLGDLIEKGLATLFPECFNQEFRRVLWTRQLQGGLALKRDANILPEPTMILRA